MNDGSKLICNILPQFTALTLIITDHELLKDIKDSNPGLNAQAPS